MGTSGLAIIQLILVRCRAMGQLKCVAAGWIAGYDGLDDTLLHVTQIELLLRIFIEGVEDLLLEGIQIEGPDFGQAAVEGLIEP